MVLLVLTPSTEKTKTQGQNSSKKLKKKTQPLGGTPLKFEKLKKITNFFEKNSGVVLKMQFLKHILSEMKRFLIFVNKFRNSLQKLKKKLKRGVNFSKTQGKNPKLKQKTETLGGSCLGLPPNCML